MKSRPLNKTKKGDFIACPSDFFRQGKVGSWKEMFKTEQESYVDKRVHKWDEWYWTKFRLIDLNLCTGPLW